jgi:hypothetical protein
MTIVDDFNEILAELDEPPTTLEELERTGFVVVPVHWDDKPTIVEVQ